MAIFKCKMCGGTLEINHNETIATCEYCGTQQTLPKLEDDRRANLYDRANHFRRNNEFDKAKGIYEQILNEDPTDAEAYWSLVLCDYGIEYVEDPNTSKRVPTVNRTQLTSIFQDNNYKSALQYADSYQRRIYETEAKAINEIQKEILAISQKEEPFDVFICYKETDNNGNRTPDSVLANDLYHQLTQEGFKVFFSRITLEDKLGSAYEPYIFAALNSAKVMIVLGTKAEYFNAAWVKNEWSRYLSLSKQGQQKVLIPAYKDMDPYDLPEEFSHLQAQDLSKLGFMQDLIRGIKKLTQTTGAMNTVQQETVVTNETVNVQSLLKRVFLFLKDGEWKKADDYCEKILDMDPENAQAYLAKFMAEFHVNEQEKIVDLFAFSESNEYVYKKESNKNYQKAILFADAELKETLMRYRYLAVYKEANRYFEVQKYQKALSRFEFVSGYLDVDEKIKQCQEKDLARRQSMKAKFEERKEQVLDRGISAGDRHTVGLKADGTVVAVGYNEDGRYDGSEWKDIVAISARFYHTVGLKVDGTVVAVGDNEYGQCDVSGWNGIVVPETEFVQRIKEAAEKRKQAERIAKEKAEAEEKAKAEAERIAKEKAEAEEKARIEAERKEKERQAEIARQKRAEQMKQVKKISKIAVPIICVIAVLFFVITNIVIPNGKYNDAVALMEAGQYEEAIVAFEALDGYKDSVDKIDECHAIILAGTYNDAVALMESGQYEESLPLLGAIYGYQDSAQLMRKALSESNIAISAGNWRTVGLKADGTVVAVGDNMYGQCDVSRWKDIVAISAGDSHTVGLQADGTVVAVGYNGFGQCDVSGWNNIVAVSAGSSHTVGLKADGTVVAVGSNSSGKCDVSGWKDIVAISAGWYHTVGIKSDGTVVAVGRNEDGQCNVSRWKVW